MGKNHFMSIKDLMILTGSSNYTSVANTHKAIRDALGKGKKKLLIKEYCEYECIDFDYVWKVLRG